MDEMEVMNNTEVVEENFGEMKRTLGVGQLVIQGMAWLCPACITVYWGIINESTNGAFPLVVIIAGIVMFMAALGYSTMSKKYTRGGSVYTYASGTFGPRLGFMTGWLILIDYFMMPMMCYLTAGLYMAIWIPQISANLWTIIIILLVWVFNYLGVNMASVINFICIAVPIVSLILTLIWIIQLVASGSPTTAGSFLSLHAFMAPDVISWKGVFNGAAVMAVTFVGFDIATTMAGEAKNPTKTVPKAVTIIVLYTIVSFALTAYLMNCGWDWTDASTKLQDPNTAITEYYVYLGYAWMNQIFIPINALASMGCCIAGNISSSRIMYNMALDGYIPKFFGKMSKRNTPVICITFACIVGLVSLLFQGQVMSAANLCSFGGLLSMVVVNICVIGEFWVKQKKRGGAAVFIYLIAPVLAAAATGFLWFQLSWLAKGVGCLWLLIGFILLGVKTKGFKETPPPMELM